MIGGCCVFNFLRFSVDEKHLIHFQSGNAVLKSLRRRLDGALSFHLLCRVITAKFQDTHRLFVSEDSAVHYLAILNTDNPDMFVLLDVDENNESAVSILNSVKKYF